MKVTAAAKPVGSSASFTSQRMNRGRSATPKSGHYKVTLSQEVDRWSREGKLKQIDKSRGKGGESH